MSDEGGYLGVLRNVTANVDTGDLSSILVEPAEEVDPRLFPQDNAGHVVFPFASIKSVRDVVVVALN